MAPRGFFRTALSRSEATVFAWALAALAMPLAAVPTCEATVSPTSRTVFQASPPARDFDTMSLRLATSSFSFGKSVLSAAEACDSEVVALP